MVELGRNALLMYCVTSVFGVGRLRCQSLVIGERCPTRMMLALCSMETVFLLKCAVQSLSQSWLMDINEFWRAGNTYACCAAGGSSGCRLMVVLWLEEMLEPSGSWTWMLSLVCVSLDGADV